MLFAAIEDALYVVRWSATNQVNILLITLANPPSSFNGATFRLEVATASPPLINSLIAFGLSEEEKIVRHPSELHARDARVLRRPLLQSPIMLLVPPCGSEKSPLKRYHALSEHL